MDFTFEISKLYNVTPFEILNQDKDSVIMLINYFIQRGRNKSDTQAAAHIGGASEKERDRDFWGAI